MRRVIFDSDIALEPNAGYFYSGVPYLLSEDSRQNILEIKKHSGRKIFRSEEPCTIRQWRFPEPAKELLLYSTGRTGDHLWLTAVVRRIKQLMPDTAIDIVVDSTSWQIWENNKDIRGVKFEPVPIAGIEEYGGVLFLDDLIAHRTDPGQGNCYKILFDAAGLPYSEDYALPILNLQYKDEHGAFALTQSPDAEQRIHWTNGHIIVGIHAAARSRNLHGVQYAELIKGLSQFIPEAIIYGVSNNDYGQQVQEMILKLGIANYRCVHNAISIRHIAALCRLSRFVIAPDSMLVHLAASQQAPTVAIMTTVPPEKRVSTYPLCVPIWKKEECDFAPCYWKGDGFRQKKGELLEIAPCYTPKRFMCDIAQSVSTTEILNACNAAMKLKVEAGGYIFRELPI